MVSPSTLPAPIPVEVLQNIEVEQALLGAILINNETFFRVGDFLLSEHFSDGIHQKIFETASGLIRENKVASPVTLKTYLVDVVDKDFDTSAYLALLAREATAIVNAEDYALLIYDLALKRKLVDISNETIHEVKELDPTSSVRDQIETLERKLFSLAENERYGEGFLSFSDATQSTITSLSEARRSGRKVFGTGMGKVDGALGGLHPSDLIIVAARPGMGKSAFATTLAMHLVKNWKPERAPDDQGALGAIVGFFSLEMTAEQVATRIMAFEAKVSSEKMRKGRLNDLEFDRLAKARERIKSYPLYVDDSVGLSIAQLASRARRLKRQKGLDLLVVDYLQLLVGTSRSGDVNRVQEVAEISTGMKNLAKELNIPVIALSQLSRQVEGRKDRRPLLSDLRDSGSIEQDADIVLFLFREEYYLINEEPGAQGSDDYLNWQKKLEEVHGIAEVIIAKHRHGPTNKVRVHFNQEFTHFSDLANESIAAGDDIGPDPIASAFDR